MAQLPPHTLGIYEVQQTKETADAVAYAFIDQGPPVQYPFKFQDLGDEEVRIQITYAGLCQSDCSTVRSKWGPCQLPACPGHEVVGVVEKVGAKVTTFKPGDRAGCNPQRDFCGDCEFCKKGLNTVCLARVFLYNPHFGGYSTHIQLPAKMTFHLPNNFKDEIGSPLLCAGVTVFAPIKRFYNPNHNVAVIGVGGLGHLAVMYAAKFGMKVTAFTTSFGRKDEITNFGASNLSSSVDLESLKKEEGKYDLVINTLHTGDEKVFNAHQKLTKARGTYIQLGIPDFQIKMLVDIDYIVQNEIQLVGSLIGTYAETDEMLKFSAEHNVYPIVETYQFEEFPAAFDKLENGRPHYRCVVNVKDWAQTNGIHKQILV